MNYFKDEELIDLLKVIGKNIDGYTFLNHCNMNGYEKGCWDDVLARKRLILNCGIQELITYIQETY